MSLRLQQMSDENLVDELATQAARSGTSGSGPALDEDVQLAKAEILSRLSTKAGKVLTSEGEDT